MKAITLYQPWASLLACGEKIYETRSWATKYRGKIAIHASKKPFDWALECNFIIAAEKALNIRFISTSGRYSIHESPNDLTRGCIIATAELVACRKIYKNPYDGVIHFLDDTDAAVCVEGNELLFGDWTPGRYAWEFKNMTMLPEPIPAKGKQRLWKWERTDLKLS